MNALTLAFVVLSLAAWLSAAIHGFAALGHLSGKNSLGQMLLHGIRWFDAENFTARGQQLQQRSGYSALAFFFCVLGLIAVAAITSSLGAH